MKKNKIEETENGFVVIPSWQEIDRAREIINEALDKSNVSTADALAALCLSTIEMVHEAKVGKAQFLCRMSNWWEELDSQIQKDMSQ